MKIIERKNTIPEGWSFLSYRERFDSSRFVEIKD
jgi:hypothetical protein